MQKNQSCGDETGTSKVGAEQRDGDTDNAVGVELSGEYEAARPNVKMRILRTY